MIYNKSKDSTKVYTLHGSGIVTFNLNDSSTSYNHIKSVGNSVTFYASNDKTWYWFATK